MIKKLIGKLTRPTYLSRFYDGCGEVTYWKAIGGMPTLDEYGHMTVDYSHNFTYVEMEQDWIGVWREKQSWWGRNEPLTDI